jgi:hypothetical protein
MLKAWMITEIQALIWKMENEEGRGGENLFAFSLRKRSFVINKEQ